MIGGIYSLFLPFTTATEIAAIRASGRSGFFSDLKNRKRPASTPSKSIRQLVRSERSGHLLRVNCWEGIRHEIYTYVIGIGKRTGRPHVRKAI
jgi:hypothetical protein